jgi:MFS-type transporter involved in bile tolerance (Atg22 family)
MDNDRTMADSTATSTSAPSCSRIPQCLFRGNPEALAWCIDNCVTITSYIGVGAFLGTALLTLANEETDEDGKLYGTIRPSSLLSTMKTIVDLLVVTLMPILGAVVDTTSRRRLFGRVTAALHCAFLGVSISISSQTWLAIAILQILWGVVVWTYTMISYSYLPDLTTSKPVMNSYTKQFAASSYISMVIYTAVVVGITASLGYMGDDDEDHQQQIDNEVATARLAQSISFTLCSIGLFVSWGYLFRKRPPLRTVPPNTSLCWMGVRQLRQTVRSICTRHQRLKWFYVSIMFSDPAIMALTILAITFYTDTLQFSASENGIVMLLMMISAVPGAYIGSFITTRANQNAVISSIVGLVILILSTILVAVLLDGPDKGTLSYIIAIGWGFGTGQKWASDRMVLLLVLPPDQNAELMGIYVFFRQILSWLPPLVFTILNEQGIEQRYGILTLTIYFVLSLLSCIQILRAEPDVVRVANTVTNDVEGESNDSGGGGGGGSGSKGNNNIDHDKDNENEPDIETAEETTIVQDPVPSTYKTPIHD